MPRTAPKEVPRWKQRGQKTTGFTPVRIDGRGGRAFARELAKAQAAQQAGSEGRKEGSAQGNALARTGAWRFRRHFLPFAWLAALLIAGAILHATAHPLAFGLLASVVIPALMCAAARGRGAWTAGWTLAAAAATSLWLPFLAVRGLHPCLGALLVTWAPFAALWVRRYRWRPSPAEKQAEAATGDVVTWDKLAAKRRWTGQLTNPETIPGGRKWQIELDGTETHIGQIMAEPRAIAAAWGKAQTEAYAEPHPTGIESKGVLTILRAGTLEDVRDWSGVGFDGDGIATIGRHADGMPTRIRGWVPMDGTRHSLFSGASGSGKTALLDLAIQLGLASVIPVIPVILDPQNGQSLPQYKDRLIYAAGFDDCVKLERGLLAGMLDRSARMASMTYKDEDGFKMKGLDFYDYRLCGLPVVMAITDEAPELLGGGGNAKLGAEMTRIQASRAKLGRKAGDMEILVAQVPSLGELGGNQALRSMFVGGNVVSLRTGEKVSQGMLGLSVDPYTLPKYFPDGSPTQGLGYAVSMDNRQAPFRADLVPKRLRRQQVEVPSLEPEFLEAMDKAMGGVSPTSGLAVGALVNSQAVRAIHEAAALVDRAERAEKELARLGKEVPREVPPQVPSPETDDAPEGRRCVDAVWQVLSDAGREMERGEIISWTGDKARSWDRKPWSIKAVGNALKDLVEGKHAARTVVKPHDGKPIYRAVVSETARNDQGSV